MKKIVVIVSVVLLATISFLSFGLPVSNAQAGFEVWSMGHTQTTVSIEWNNLTPPSSSPGTVNSYQYTVFASVNGTDGPFIIAGNISAGICIGTFTNLSTARSYWFYVVADWGSYPRTNTLQTYTTSYMRLDVAFKWELVNTGNFPI